jgi:hypothetical protein
MKHSVMVHNLIAALLFFVVANPKTFQMVDKVLPVLHEYKDGVPTQVGLLVHSLVFVLLLSLVSKLNF